MLIGVGLFVWLIMHARKDRFSPEYYNPVEVVGLYWHFVDIVWIFIYPLFYLINPVW
jgi:cytochrome c oxidase subunit 3